MSEGPRILRVDVNEIDVLTLIDGDLEMSLPAADWLERAGGPNRSLAYQEVWEIRCSYYLVGAKQADLARQFEVSTSTINRVISEQVAFYDPCPFPDRDGDPIPRSAFKRYWFDERNRALENPDGSYRIKPLPPTLTRRPR